VVRLAAPFRPIVEPTAARPPETISAAGPVPASTPERLVQPTPEPKPGVAVEPAPAAAPITA
jgi:hypothetical protein